MIVGATSDIGRALAARFAREGHALHLVARNLQEIEADAVDLNIRYGAPVQRHVLDVTDLAAAAPLLEGLDPKPSIVICVAGVMPPQEICAEDADAAALTVQTNLTAAGWLMEQAARYLVARSGDAAIIGISSVAGDRGRAKNYWYGASKAGFTAVLSGLRQKYARSNLHVMTVKPGFVRTRMTEGMDLPAALTSVPEDVADLIFKRLMAKRHVVYDLRWRLIMTVIRLMPESLFRRLSF
jgi:short-subunit dehydrogenase